MTDRERVVYRLLIGVAVLASVAAATTTYLASDSDAAWQSLSVIVDNVPAIPARYWARGSDFPDLTAIYFFWAWPVFPASLTALAARHWSSTDILGAARTTKMGLKSAFASLFMLALGLSMLWCMDGEEIMYVPIGRLLLTLLVLGWLPFAVGGCVAGLGVIGLRRIYGPSTSTNSVAKK